MLPHWDLSSIYPSVDSKEFQDDLNEVSLIAKEIIENMDTLFIKEILDRFNEASALLSNVYSYATVSLTTDTKNEKYLKAVGKAEDAELVYKSAWKAFLRCAKERKEELLKDDVKEYKTLLNDVLIESEHLMEKKQEDLADEMLAVSSSSWSRLQEAVTSSASDGGKTLIELRALSSNHSRDVRRDAYYREKKILKEHEIALAYSLNGVKGTTLLLEERRGWKDSLERSLFSSRLSRESLDALISAIEENIPLFRRYLKAKAKLLNLDVLSWYDLFAPVSKDARHYSYEDAKEIVYSSFNAFSPEMGAFVKNAFDNSWIDAEPREGKVGGAYDEVFKKSGESRVLLNYDYTYDSVSTLAHELGHAYHDSVVKDIPPLLSDYPMTLAETASTFSETVVLNEVLKDAKGEERLYLIEQFLSSVTQTCLDILSRFYFEKAAFEKRKEGELSAREYSDLMLDAQNRTYGDSVIEKHEYMWAVKCHYYSEDFSFYNYPYAFGELFSLSLYKKSKEDRDFANTYRSLLKETGKESVEQVASLAGFDIRKKDFYLDALSIVSEYVKELEICL